MSIPNKLPEWDITEVNSVEVDQQHKDEGWLAPAGVPEKPPFQTFNWWQNLVYKWIKYFNEFMTGYVKDYAALSVLTGMVDGQAVNVTGDGISGTFVYDSTKSAVNDGGTIIDGWVRQYIGPVNVLWFGAISNGIFDNSSIFSSIFSNFIKIYIPSGIFNLESSVTINKSVQISGESQIETVLSYNGILGGIVLNFVGTDGTPNNDIQFSNISNFSIVGNSLATTGIKTSYVYHSTFSNIAITSCSIGLHTELGFYNRFENIHAYQNTLAGIRGGDTCNSNTFTNCRLYQNRFGIYLSGPSSHGNNISFCSFESNSENGLYIYDSDENNMTSNYFESNLGVTGTFSQIYIGAKDGSFRSPYNKIISNEFTGAEMNIIVDYADDTTIIGNSINFGIRVTSNSVRANILDNNKFQGTYTDDGSSTKFRDATLKKEYIKEGNELAYQVTYGGVATVLETTDNYLDVKINGSVHTRFENDGSLRLIGGTFSKALRLGSYYLWVSSAGKLYINSTAPANDTDGTIVGTQV